MFGKKLISLSIGAMMLAGGTAFAQNVQTPQADQSQYYYVMPDTMMGQDAYPMMSGYSCPYFNGQQAYQQNYQQVQPQTQAQSQNTQGFTPKYFKHMHKPSLASQLDMIDNYLNLNDAQQDAFGQYAQALLNAHKKTQSANQALASATDGQARISASIQNLKDRIASLENISKLRKAFIATLNPQQVQKFEFAETNPAAAMAQAAQTTQDTQQSSQTAQAPQISQSSSDDSQVIYFVPSSFDY